MSPAVLSTSTTAATRTATVVVAGCIRAVWVGVVSGCQCRRRRRWRRRITVILAHCPPSRLVEADYEQTEDKVDHLSVETVEVSRVLESEYLANRHQERLFYRLTQTHNMTHLSPIHTADATQLLSWVASAVCTEFATSWRKFRRVWTDLPTTRFGSVDCFF